MTEQTIEVISHTSNYFQVSNEIFENGLSPYEISVYCYLCRLSNNSTKKSYPSLKRIAEKTCMSRGKVISSISSLVEKQIIYKQSGNSYSSNRYHLLPIDADKQRIIQDICSSQDEPSTHEIPRSAPHELPSTHDEPPLVPDMNPIKTNITKTKVKKTKVTTPVFPPPLDNDEFKEIWAEWVAHKKAKGKKMPETTIKKQLTFLCVYKIDKIREIIDNSIQNDWAGLFPPRNTNNSKPPEKQMFKSTYDAIKKQQAEESNQ